MSAQNAAAITFFFLTTTRGARALYSKCIQLNVLLFKMNNELENKTVIFCDQKRGVLESRKNIMIFILIHLFLFDVKIDKKKFRETKKNRKAFKRLQKKRKNTEI